MTLSVLAVDDSRTMRDLLSQALSEAGFGVTVAEDGRDGLDKLEDRRPDVVITDINMPRMDGFEFIEAVRGSDRWPGLPILVLTTESAQTMKDRARRAGASGWIVKPFEETRLVTAIRRVTGGA
ncbi:response regulator [Tranquillimonas alkanivorans]|uniref:Two-component system, chemotaxis family, response regulator CheY n=1 Tax=Tranquillimonas alkanivorans TaxID=441119 RepID=A0A1I5SAB6_9RHOB|nr:response regulator [Tranquillimonas alkanivorans]SFP67665.1 two-component system, chemotaxis family, response regulator CheY [Tranquillimonas alkanivorans]